MLLAAGYLVYKWPSTGSILILFSAIITLFGMVGPPLVIRAGTLDSTSVGILIQSVSLFNGILLTLGILMLAVNAPRRVRRPS